MDCRLEDMFLDNMLIGLFSICSGCLVSRGEKGPLTLVLGGLDLIG